VWCIFDVEAKVTQQGRPGLAAALKMAKDNGISIALSNPCFEIWILLHAEDHQAPIYSDRAQGRCSELQLVKGKHIADAGKLLQRYSVARDRAQTLDVKHDREQRANAEDRNPSSSFYKLVEALFEAFPPR
jgi:hypothetical protein